MAFSHLVSGQTVFGNKRVVYGTYTNGGGDTGGDVTTSLSEVEVFVIQPMGSAVVASAPVVNETLPLSNAGGVVTVVTTDNEDGYWIAVGV